MTRLRKARQERLLNKMAMRERPTLHGMVPPTIKQIVESEAGRPLKGGDKELEHTSLFGDSHKQMGLFG